MEMEREETTTEEERTSTSRGLGLSIIVGALLGYVAGKLILNRPALGTALGLVLGFVTSSSDEEE